MIGWLIGSCASLVVYTIVVGFTFSHPHVPIATSTQVIEYLKTNSIPANTATKGQTTTISFEIPESNWLTVINHLKPLLEPQDVVSLSQTVFTQSRTVVLTIQEK